MKVVKWGNGVGVRIPADLFEKSGLTIGQEVEVVESPLGLLIRPGRQVFSLAQLVAGITPENRPEVVSWGPDVGAEVIRD